MASTGKGHMMKINKKVMLRLPRWIASVLMIFFTALWTFWGIAEMYHEGWWGTWYHRLPYLVPIAVTLLPSLVAFRWPLVGGTLIVGVGVFAFFFFGNAVALIGLGIALMGAAFLVDGVVKRKAAPEATSQAQTPSHPWWRCHWRSQWRYRLLLGILGIIIVGVSAYMLPIVLTRVDDGDRSVRRIEGNGVTLIWAPEGPGWNWHQPWGGNPRHNYRCVRAL
jgi:hypothetical protein